MTLSEKEQQEINALIERFETQTGVEAVAAVVGRCDAYPEIPWKAYALGSALGALAVVLYPGSLSGWDVVSSIAADAMAILGAGAFFAAMAVLVPAFGRVFLDRTRAEGEVRQYAIGMFLDRELFRTSRRCAVLLLVSRYERVTVVLPDTGIRRNLPPGTADHLAQTMGTALSRHGVTAAFEAGLTQLEALIEKHKLARERASGDTLDDAIVSEKGA